jgi:hypothetical protein
MYSDVFGKEVKFVVNVVNFSLDLFKQYAIQEGKKIVMEYIGDWQPVGKNRCKFRRLTDKIIRSSAFVKISYS